MQKLIYRILMMVLLFLGGAQGYQMQISTGEKLNGIVTYVIDGDTLRVNGIKVRLWGVDAPEKEQDYYTTAKNFLVDEVLLSSVSCLVHDKDRYGRVVAQCTRTKDGADIGALLVAEGLAKDYTRHSKRFYLPQQIKAQIARKNIWN